jgi:pyruvate formate-lyase/glycerol dehydratase family glycyl radical enzyme
MSTVSATSVSVWDTFDSLRDHLYDQFQDVPYDQGSGLPVDQLRQEIEHFLASHPEMPRVLQKAHMFRIVVTLGQIHVDPHDWYADKLNHGGLVREIRDGWFEAARADASALEDNWNDRLEEMGAFHAYYLDLGHISPGWENMLAGGLSGLLAQARQYREQLGADATEEQLAFYEAVEIVYEASIALAERFAAQAEALVALHPEHADRLRMLAAACRRVPAHAPQTFHEALQFAWLMHELIEMEGEYVRSMGHFDRTFYPYYRADVEAGRLTRKQAKELIKFLWFRYYARTRGHDNGKNFVFGGQYPDGAEVTNELTYLALEAYEELNTPDPKLSVRYTPATEEQLYYRVADLIRRGHNSFVLMNDVPAIEALVMRGKSLPDARFYLPIGCYEPAVEGKEVGCTMNVTFNLAKGIELALYDGRDPLTGEQVGPHTGDPSQFETFEELYQAYTAQMDYMLTRTITYMREHEAMWPQVNPSPLIAGTIDDCLARGQDIGEGGAHYNATGCVGAALANACDSLVALKQAVFDEGRYSMDQILDAIDSDYEGQEPMRQYLLHRGPKWGNGEPEADQMARRIADYYCDKIHTFGNGRGGPCQAALFSLTAQWTFGKATGALPDGRHAREALSPGVGAMSGRDRNGVTALLHSVSGLDFTKTPNGAVLDVTLHPTAVRGADGLDAFVGLIKTFFAEGGYAIQFNVFDVEDLRDAQRHPERYASLQIRVTGWSVHFNSLSRYEQDQFILRQTHTM